MTGFADKTRFLLILNLFLQLVDGTLSYGLLSLPNLSAHMTTTSWASATSLFYNKALAAALLLLIYVLRPRREVMVSHALTITASVYTCYAAASLMAYWSR